MNKIIQLSASWATLMLVVVFMTACEREQIPQVTQVAPESAVVQDQERSRALDQPWPPPIEGEEVKEVADDVLAVNYYVVLDDSGSMDDSECSGDEDKMTVAKRALLEFMRSVPDKANLGIGLLNGGDSSYELVSLGSDNRDAFTAAVQGVDANGGTPLHDAVMRAYKALMRQGRRQLGYGEYHLVVVTDGAANFGQDPTEVVNDIVQNSPVVITTIGFCIGEDHALNQPGRTVYKAADNPGALSAGLQSVLAESPVFDATAFEAINK